MTTPLTQTLHHSFPESQNTASAFAAAENRLRNLVDNETKSIFAPLLENHENIVSPIEKLAASLRAKAKHLIVVGSGGSGLSGNVFSALHTEISTHQLHVVDSCDLYIAHALMANIKPEDSALLLVSKSGTTVETLVFADVFLRWMSALPDLQQRVVTITMHDGNLLHKKAQASGWKCIKHDPNLCGRFSILSAVGLLPAAFVGMDIAALLRGAEVAWHQPKDAIDAAKFQFDAIDANRNIHVCFAYGARFAPLSQWWRQSIAESLGKGGKGVFPIRAEGTRDQHSQLQLYLDGPPQAIYTLITEESTHQGEKISNEILLPFLASHTVGDVIQSQQMATLETLKNTQKTVRHLALKKHDMETIGRLISQWIQEIILLGYMLEINPFNQPAVEESKRLAREFINRY
jgi:glucose-6-phosphate isomerase